MKTLTANDYAGIHGGRQGQSFVPFPVTLFRIIRVLPQLNGKPWDDVALGLIHSLRPSHIRVTDRGTQCDGQTWRVTVFLDPKDKTIRYIQHEVEIGCPSEEGATEFIDLIDKCIR